MPPVSQAQRVAAAIAEHSPGKLLARNRGMLGMSKPQLSEFASGPTDGLPKYSKFAAGGPVPAPTSYYNTGGPVGYDQGGEVDVSMASKPVLPSTPSMEANKTVGYAKGGVVGKSNAAKSVRGLPRYIGRYASGGDVSAAPAPQSPLVASGGPSSLYQTMPPPSIPDRAQIPELRGPFPPPSIPNDSARIPELTGPFPPRQSIPDNSARIPENAGPFPSGGQRPDYYARGGSVGKRKAPAKFRRGGVVGGTDPQTEGAKPPLRGRVKPKLGRAARVAKFEQDNGDEEI